MLTHYLARAAATWPDAVAVRGPDGEMTFAALEMRAAAVARALRAAGVGARDRVALWMPKSAGAVAAMHGVLRLGAVYVPVDIFSPPARARAVMVDCGVKAVIAGADVDPSVLSGDDPIVLVRFEETSEESPEGREPDAPDDPPSTVGPDDLAYILYTSGSTGRPKGVCITHRNALAFVEWAVAAIGARPGDRFANHAPFHFDLSVLDVYGALAVGGTVCIVPEGTAYMAEPLVRFLREERVNVWYSVPSALVLMMEHGGLLHEAPPALRTLLFAGEPFPMKELRRLRKAWPAVPMWNLYGPTETNVCTAYPVKSIDPEASSIPIGHAVSGDRVWVRRDDGTEANVGEEGELVVVGPTVFPGYWGQPRRTEEAYGTGDRVVLAADGELRYCGRRDHMVKVRGHRVELGDVEAAVLQHASVRNAAAFVRSEGLAARLVVCLAVGSERPPTLLEMKRFCAERLPRSMIPDEVIAMPELPRNRNGKIDRQALAAAAQPDASAT